MALFKKSSGRDVPPRRRQSAEPNAAPDFMASHRSVSFRRNRTLTGSSSPLVASANELDAEHRSPRAHVHHLSRHRNWIMWRFVVALVACGALYIAISQYIAVTVATTGTQSVVLSDAKAKEYAHTVEAYFGGHPVERFKVYLNQDELETYLQAHHPEIASSTLEQTGQIGRAQLTVQMRRPVARWIIDGKTDFVDESGVVFDYTPFERPAIEIVNNNIAAGVPASATVSRYFLGFVGQTVGQATKQGLTVTKVTIPVLTIRQLELQLSGVGYPVKLTTDRPAGEQVEDMVRVVRYLKQRGISPQYIDVRVAGKTFYK